MLKRRDLAEASGSAKTLAAGRGLLMIPGFDDPYIVSGQGTLGLELATQCPEAEQVIVPVGGGGLIGGVATGLAALCPRATVIGVQAKAAPGAARSFEAGEIVRHVPAPTPADGTAVAAPGALPFALMQRYVSAMVTVDEESIAQAIVLLLERSRLVVDGAGALGLAALLSGAIDTHGKKTVVVISGGNIDINLLAAIVQHGLLHANRYLTLTVDLDDSPGTLSRLLALIAETGANVLEVDHIRQGIQLPVRGVEVRLLLETRDAEHIEDLTRRLVAEGYVLTESTATSRSFRPAGWG
jgi:threonine dehydratase